MRSVIKGLDINYQVMGEGRPLLILHGWGSNSEKWQKLGELLVGKGIKVVIPDLPGFGRSQKPLLAWGLDEYSEFLQELIEFLNLERFCLLGHSFGGALAVKYSLKFPEKIDKLFLVGAACFRRKALKKRLFFVIAKVLRIFSFLPFYSILRKGFYKFIVQSDYPLAEGVVKESYLRIIKEDLSEILPKIQVPTVIIWGEKDKIKKIKDARLINEKIKNSRLEIIPDIGHNPHLENPEELSEIIIKNL